MKWSWQSKNMFISESKKRWVNRRNYFIIVEMILTKLYDDIWINMALHTYIYIYICRVFTNDGSKIRGVVGNVKISGKCQKN